MLQIKIFMIKTDKKWLVYGGFLLLAALLVVVWAFWGRGGSSGVQEQPGGGQKTEERVFYSISHQKVTEEVSKKRPMGVMIENHPDSRPQSGLSAAEVVYEIVAEGGITRFFAVFQQGVAKIGPVRSARPYYAEIADSWKALYAHVGGSPDALKLIGSGKLSGLDDVNEFYNGDYFWRDKSRSAPHNVYTSTDNLESYLKNEELETALKEQKLDLEFVEEELSGLPGLELTLNFSDPGFLAKFSYDPTQKKYLRTIAGKADVDAGNSQNIAPSTVVVLETQMSEILGDAEGRMKVATAGGGEARVFSGGVMQTGVWKRESGGEFKFTDEFGRPIRVMPGQVWIAFVDSLSEQLK